MITRALTGHYLPVCVGRPASSIGILSAGTASSFASVVRLVSTASETKAFFLQVNEVDRGGSTTNVFHLAQRVINSGLKPTAADINEIQGLTGTPSAITDGHVALFQQAFDDRQVLPGTLATVTADLKLAYGLPNKQADFFVVYLVVRKLADGSEVYYVGCSTVGAERLSKHSQGKSNGTLSQAVAVYGSTAFKVHIMLMPDVMEDKLAFLLAFEQWAILYLFGYLGFARINKLLVAGSGKRDISPDEILRMQEQFGTPVHVYEGESLIYTFLTIKSVSTDTALNWSLVLKLLEGGGKLGNLTVTTTPVSGAPQALMAKDAFIPYFNAMVQVATKGALDAWKQGLLTGTSAETATGTKTLHTSLGRLPMSLMTAVYVYDRSQTYTGFSMDMAKWMQDLTGTGTRRGVADAHRRKARRYLAFELSYPDSSTYGG